MTNKNPMFTKNNSIFRIFRKIRVLTLRIFYWIENDNNIDFTSNGEGYFIDAVVSYFAKLEGMRLEIFDIGGNRGDYTQILLEKSYNQKLNARIHVFEPTTSCFKLLTDRFAKLSNIILNQLAVSNSNGDMEIYYDQQESPLASLYQRNLSAIGMSLSQSETIQTTRLDAYIRGKEITHIHLLKIDIEGHEIAAFEGIGDYLSGDFVDFIQFEYGGANLDSKSSLMDFYAMLEKREFVIGKLMPRGVELRAYEPWMDNFQYANYVAISRRVVEKLRT
jgi:FkbM family methyltransferase